MHISVNFGQRFNASLSDDSLVTSQRGGVRLRVLILNGESMRIQLKGIAEIMASVDVKVRRVTLLELFYVDDLPWDIILHGKLKRSGASYAKMERNSMLFTEATDVGSMTSTKTQQCFGGAIC